MKDALPAELQRRGQFDPLDFRSVENSANTMSSNFLSTPVFAEAVFPSMQVLLLNFLLFYQLRDFRSSLGFKFEFELNLHKMGTKFLTEKG